MAYHRRELTSRSTFRILLTVLIISKWDDAHCIYRCRQSVEWTHGGIRVSHCTDSVLVAWKYSDSWVSSDRQVFVSWCLNCVQYTEWPHIQLEFRRVKFCNSLFSILNLMISPSWTKIGKMNQFLERNQAVLRLVWLTYGAVGLLYKRKMMIVLRFIYLSSLMD